ncbi:hypothetical protein ACFVH6_29455 [Spirillospora sp. NPDC127200]
MTVSQDTSISTGTLEELRAAYRAQLDQLAAERDEARLQARKAKAAAYNAQADLASLKARVQELLKAVAAQLDRAVPDGTVPDGAGSGQAGAARPVSAQAAPDQVLSGRVVPGRTAPNGAAEGRAAR